MITVQVDGVDQTLSDLSEGWLQQQLHARNRARSSLCIKIFIRYGNIDMVLASCDCPRGRPSNRNATVEEIDIFNLWDNLGLNAAPIDCNKLISFLHRIRGLS